MRGPEDAGHRNFQNSSGPKLATNLPECRRSLALVSTPWHSLTLADETLRPAEGNCAQQVTRKSLTRRRIPPTTAPPTSRGLASRARWGVGSFPSRDSVCAQMEAGKSRPDRGAGAAPHSASTAPPPPTPTGSAPPTACAGQRSGSGGNPGTAVAVGRDGCGATEEAPPGRGRSACPRPATGPPPSPARRRRCAAPRCSRCRRRDRRRFRSRRLRPLRSRR